MHYVLLNEKKEIIKQTWFDEHPGQPNPVKGIAWYPLVEVKPGLQETEKVGTEYTITIDKDKAIKTYTPVEKSADELAVAQKIADIADALPAWQQVSDAIDSVTTIAAMKAILKKLARVVYWLAKNTGA